MTRKIILYIAMSLDGFIAGNNDDLSFLSVVNRPGEDYGYEDFTATIDTVIMGRKTYDKVLSFGIDFPHRTKKCYVLSRSRQGNDENVEFYSGNPRQLIENIHKAPGKNIFIDGGAETVFEFMKEGLIDTFIISILPVFVGSGVLLFKENRPFQQLNLARSVSFPSGLVQLWYEKS